MERPVEPAARPADLNGLGDLLSEDWYYATNGIQAGPIGLSVLQQLLCFGEVAPSDLVWRSGMPCWIPADQVSELAGFSMVVDRRTVPSVQAAAPSGGRELSGMAVSSLILGILGLTVLPGVASIPAVILGHFALGQIQRQPEAYSGQGQALTGLITGYVALGLILLGLIVLFVGAIMAK